MENHPSLLLLQSLDFLFHILLNLPIVLVTQPELSVIGDIKRLPLHFEVEIWRVTPHHIVVLTHAVISIRRHFFVALVTLVKRECLVQGLRLCRFSKLRALTAFSNDREALLRQNFHQYLSTAAPLALV